MIESAESSRTDLLKLWSGYATSGASSMGLIVIVNSSSTVFPLDIAVTLTIATPD